MKKDSWLVNYEFLCGLYHFWCNYKNICKLSKTISLYNYLIYQQVCAAMSKQHVTAIAYLYFLWAKCHIYPVSFWLNNWCYQTRKKAILQKSWSTGRVSLEYQQSIVGIRSDYHWNTMEGSLEYHGSIGGISLEYHGSIIEVFGVSLKHHGSIVGVPAEYCWNTMGVSLEHHGSMVGAPWKYRWSRSIAFPPCMLCSNIQYISSIIYTDRMLSYMEFP